MKILNKSLFLLVLLVFPLVSFGQATNIGGSIESGSATKIEAGGEVVVTPDGSPMEIPIRYTGDVNKPPSANSSVRFSLKVGEKRLFSEYLGMTITLNSLSRYKANMTITTIGGCGPNASPSCLGAPGFEETFNMKLGELKIIPGTGTSLTFAQKLSKNESIFILTTPTGRPLPTPTSTEPPTPSPTPNCPTDSLWDPRSNICRPTGPYPSPSISPKPSTIKNFEDCVRAGYPVGQSYPATCWTPDGRHFVEKIVEERDLPSTVSEIDVVTEVKEIDGSYEIKAKQKGRVLFLVPVEIDVSYSVEGSITTNIKRPWWSFLVW